MKTLKQYIQEAFDTPYKYQQSYGNDSVSYKFITTSNKNVYVEIKRENEFYKIKSEYNFFKKLLRDNKSDKKVEDLDIFTLDFTVDDNLIKHTTNYDADSLRIFSTVVNILRSFYKENHVDAFVFVALHKKFEDFYLKLLKKYSQKEHLKYELVRYSILLYDPFMGDT